jgi:hypothetical protein
MFRVAGRGELVPELGNTNGVPGHGLGFDWGNLVDSIGQAVEVGGTIYDKYISHDAQDAALELAKLNASTEATRARAAALQAQTAGGYRPGAGLLGMGLGTLALLAGGGLALFMLLRRRR